jgi:hypothetical protein
MGTAVKGSLRFDAVADDLAVAVLADRREQVDRALEAVECMGSTRGNDLKRHMIVIATDFALCHVASSDRGGAVPPPEQWPHRAWISSGGVTGSPGRTV